ncbi:MAG: peptidylprolyl isomerase [Acidocella sp. 20-57-95]|nr:MAG: peptidylprolyl isomerase [Acidocella sp. 20-57-95]OYV59246.1 MAG: peptidylprolyl isomerase [Acidocella sp. 21-58-7]HQT64364.1 peptidylprolyl isomerase [Acidocella sp.]HQU03696.1 peptidylprolyl isomerase [Acidocella sp.]
MRHLPKISALALVTALFTLPALAQTTAPAPAPAAAPADPVLATVDGTPIHMSDVQSAAAGLPAQMQQMKPEQLFPLLVNQLIDRQALLIAANAENLNKDPKVQALMQAAANEQLENSYVQQQVAAQVTDAAVQAEYNKDYAGKPGPAQVEARHILVKTQAQALDIIKQLEHGADFAKLAAKYSIDPGAKDGGELGWFSQNEMVPAFADAAFALKPGEYTKTPVQTQFGWHVILSEGKRTGPAPSFDDVKDQIRQTLADNTIKATLDNVRSKVKVQLFNPDGTPAVAPAAPAAGTPAKP